MGEKALDKECPINKKPSQEKKLVKATELPQHGNPFPSKDVIDEDKPGLIETKVRSLRTTIQPYVSPVATAYERTSDFVSVGIAHSQSGMQRLAENQSSVLNALLISGSGLIGIALARRKGIFKKLLFGSVFFGGAMAACYPKEAEVRAQQLFYIAQNKLPVLAKQQYDKVFNSSQNDDATANISNNVQGTKEGEKK